MIRADETQRSLGDKGVSPRAENLSAFVQRSLAQLRQHSGDRPSQTGDSVLFVGTWNDSIPRLLIRDPILKPTEVRLWAVIRTLTDPSSPTAMPGAESLASQCNVSSRTTITTALLILRITRWISLCARVRDQGGRFAGCVYALHDEPATLADAMHLDPEYVSFLHEMTQHSTPRVRQVATGVLGTIEDAICDGVDVTQEAGLHERAVHRLQCLASLSEEGWPALLKDETETPLSMSARHMRVLHQEDVSDDSPHPSDTRVQKMVMDHHDQNLVADIHHHDQILNTGKKPKENQHDKQCQNLNMATTCSSSKKITTTNTNTDSELEWPTQINRDERLLAISAFTSADLDARQSQELLDELQGRLSGGQSIRNPVGWLISMSKRINEGTFNVTSFALQARRARESRAAMEARVEHSKRSAPPAPSQAVSNNKLTPKIEAMRRKAKLREAK